MLRLLEGFSHFVTSKTAPKLPAGAVAGWVLHPLESAAFPRRTPKAVIRSPLDSRDQLRTGLSALSGGQDTTSVSSRPPDHIAFRVRVAYRSVNATSRELNTGLNIYRMIDFEPV